MPRVYGSEEGNAPRWTGVERPFYEVYYLTFNDPAARRGGWLRFTLKNPLAGAGAAEVWGFFFDARDPGKGVALKETHPLKAWDAVASPFRIALGECVLRNDGSVGRLRDAAGSEALAWDLRWPPAAATLRQFPFAWMYRLGFPTTKVTAPNFAVPYTGTVTVRGEAWRLDGAPGQQAHLWGTRHAHRWAWGRAGGFAEDGGAAFEGLSAVARPGMQRLSLFLLREGDGTEHAWRGLADLVFTHSENDVLSWRFATRPHGRFRLSGEYRAPPEATYGVEYTDPDGSKRYCHHTEVASLELRLEERRGREYVPSKTFTVRSGAAFEAVEPAADPRIPVRV